MKIPTTADADLFPVAAPRLPDILGNGTRLAWSNDWFSADGAHRFALEYCWNPNPAASWLTVIGQNPSTANRWKSDATVIRCARRAFGMGLAGLLMLNVFTLVSTDPEALWTHPEPDRGADDAIRGLLERCVGPIIFAPGGHPHPLHRARCAAVERLVRAGLGRELLCLGTTAAGLPRHPSRLGYAVQPEPWRGSYAQATR